MITRKGRDIGICFLRTCLLKPVSVAGLVEPRTHVSGPTSVPREQHASPSVFRIHSSYTPAGNALNRSSLEAWRRTLPSVEEMHQVLKLQAKKQPLPTEQSVMDWRDCVKITREAYENEMRGGVQSLSFKEWLLQRSLVDSHARRHSYLRISLTEKCNLRCLYCMPEEGVDLTPHGHLLNTEEIVKLVELFALAGVNKVRLTGGEPTIRKDLADIVKQISSIEGIKDVGITSNGLVLSRSLEQLKDAGLSLINLSLDTLKPARFEQMTRRKGHERVLGSINKALDLGYNPVKINVVVMKGVNDDEILDFVELTRNKNVNVRFIEYMPFDGNTSGDGLVRFADGHGEVAKNFRVPGFKGSVSFITSMTSTFCGDCNRVRLMADGNIKVCLFGNNEVSLLDALREGATDEDLLAVVSAAVDRKKAAHAGMDILHTLKNRPMVKIGG
ncbi:hypothetical protein M9435_000105 [Picochlorum sp. BPE23]|nr:hypothetical protein M9435_000105 [Picochlorum sp. BPE23]